MFTRVTSSRYFLYRHFLGIFSEPEREESEASPVFAREGSRKRFPPKKKAQRILSFSCTGTAISMIAF